MLTKRSCCVCKYGCIGLKDKLWSIQTVCVIGTTQPQTTDQGKKWKKVPHRLSLFNNNQEKMVRRTNKTRTKMRQPSRYSELLFCFESSHTNLLEILTLYFQYIAHWFSLLTITTFLSLGYFTSCIFLKTLFFCKTARLCFFLKTFLQMKRQEHSIHLFFLFFAYFRIDYPWLNLREVVNSKDPVHRI